MMSASKATRLRLENSRNLEAPVSSCIGQRLERLERLEPALACNVLNGVKRLNDWNVLNELQVLSGILGTKRF
jgi:hypothetical protein